MTGTSHMTGTTSLTLNPHDAQAERELPVWLARLMSGAEPESTQPIDQLLKARAHRCFEHELPLSRATVEALCELIQRAVFGALAELGASRQPYVDLTRDQLKRGQLWTHPTWSSLELTFTDKSLELACLLYQLSSPDLSDGAERQLLAFEEARDQAQGGVGSFEALGDALFHLFALERLKALPLKRALKGFAKLRARLVSLSPLTELLELQGEPTRPMPSFERLITPELTPLWPWLGAQLTNAWLQAERDRFPQRSQATQSSQAGSRKTNRASFQQVSQNQALRLKALEALAKRTERLDLLIPLVSYYQALPQQYERATPPQTLINELYQEVKLSERHTLLEPYLTCLRGARVLTSYERATLKRHPADREWAERLFLHVYQAADLTASREQLEAYANALSPELG